jgi:hypothetical protein
MTTTSSPENDPRPDGDELQFERAEYGSGGEPAGADAPTCAACKAPLSDVY